MKKERQLGRQQRPRPRHGTALDPQSAPSRSAAAASAPLRIIGLVSTGVPLAIGLVATLAHHWHPFWLMEIARANYWGMVYNTTLLALFGSLSLVAAWARWRVTSIAFASFVAVLAGASLLQTWLGVDFGIDQIFAPNEVPTTHPHPGRVAPVTAVSFVLIGLSAILLHVRRRRLRPLLLGSLISVPLALGGVLYLGYLVGVPASYASGVNLVHMPLYSAACVACCSLSLACLLLRQRPEGDEFPAWVPVLVSCAGVTITVIIWQALLKHSRALEAALDFRHVVTTVLVGGIATSALLGSTCELVRRARIQARQSAALANALGHQLQVHAETMEKLRTVNDRYQTMIDTANDAFVSLDSTGRIQMWNPQAERTFGWTRDEAIGRRLIELIVPEQERAAHSLETGEPAGRERRIEMIALRRDGLTVPVEMTIWPVRVNDVVTFEAFIRDNSERKRWESALELSRDAAERANRAKSDFLAQMSHEIRTPMNAIVGMAELLKESNLDSQQHAYVELFQRAGRNLLSLINDILDLSKIEAGHLELEQIEFDLDEILSDVTHLLAPRAYAKGLELNSWVDPRTPYSLTGDPDRLKQVLVNLIGNAIKFTERGAVELSVAPDPQAAGRVRFAIRDTGIGIAPEDCQTIFEKFAQVDNNATRRGGGTGLGLAISRQLVSLMKGEIAVESAINEGSTFSFTAEFALRPEASSPAWARTEDFAGLRVLVIDDLATNRLILHQTLLAWGFLVTEANSPASALERLAESVERPFSLVLVDRQMPGGDGLELAQKILELHPKLPLLLLASDCALGDAARCQQLGLAGYLVKPVQRKNLLVGLRRAFGKYSAPVETIEPAPLPVPTGERVRVLLAEDSTDNQFLLRAFLKDTEYVLEIVDDGLAAIERFKANHYDIVLMDVRMPFIDGLTATAKIREWEQRGGQRRTPILALTAHALVEDTQKSLDAGCDGHLTKPIAKARLMEALRSFGPTGSAGAIDITPPEGLEELIPRYLESRRQDIAALRQALRKNDFERIRTLGHNMKGTGTPYGFTALTELGARLEAAAKDRNRERSAAQIRELSIFLDRVTLQPAAAS